MNDLFNAYLEDYHEIKIIVPSTFCFDKNNIYLSNNSTHLRTPLTIFKEENVGGVHQIWCSFFQIVHFECNYVIVFDTVCISLWVGRITRSLRFEQDMAYDGPLGVIYEKNQSSFYLWAPVAQQVVVLINNSKYSLSYYKCGAWKLVLSGDFKNALYSYSVYYNDSWHNVVDPYAIASTSNGKCGYIIDSNETYSMDARVLQEPPFPSIIEEMNVRDYSMNLDVSHPGTYMGVCESMKLEGVGLPLLKDLGIHEIQIMPLNLFGGVDETITDFNNPQFLYNWGYNPINYFVPSGFYATDSKSPLTRINECKKMIDCLHQSGFLVYLDVVYNHVWNPDTFSYSLLCPGYSFQYDERGYLTNSSFCGNDLAVQRTMIKRLMIDSLIHWMKFYGVDGFRFDLMGLLSISTMNEVASELKKIKKYCKLYGEGWNMPSILSSVSLANMKNYWQLPEYAFFNDTFRNFFVSQNMSDPAFLFGNGFDKDKLYQLITGSSIGEWMFERPSQSLNYIECHDNETFYDRFMSRMNHLDLFVYKDYLRLSYGILMLSFGIPFLHMGQSFGQTKYNEGNTYNMGDKYNAIVWNNIKEYEDVLTTLKALIDIRRDLDFIFKWDNPELIRLQTSLESGNVFEMRITYELSYYLIFIQNNYDLNKHYFAPGTICLFDGEKKTSEEVHCFNFSKPGVYIFKH